MCCADEIEGEKDIVCKGDLADAAVDDETTAAKDGAVELAPNFAAPGFAAVVVGGSPLVPRLACSAGGVGGRGIFSLSLISELVQELWVLVGDK